MGHGRGVSSWCLVREMQIFLLTCVVCYTDQHFFRLRPKATKKFERVKGSDPPSIMPDIEIEPTFDDWSKGRDPVLQAILKTD